MDMEVWIGCTGWFYPGWKGLFYPREFPVSRWFTDHYSRVFRTVELSSPFYRFPLPSTVKAWEKKAPAGFKYTLKVTRIITHIKKFKGTARLLRDFYRLGEVLGDKMGCFLFQLPPWLRYEPDRLQRILDSMNERWINVVEFRHRSWWIDAVREALKERGVTFCAVSAPGLPNDLWRTTREVYLRLHGTSEWYNHDYSAASLRPWARKLLASGASRAWVYFNNDVHARAPANAQVMERILRRQRATG